MEAARADAPPSALGELRSLWSRRRLLWNLVPRADRLGFAGTVAIMALVALVETGIALLLGRFFDDVLKLGGAPAGSLVRFAVISLGILAGAYVFKESLILARRWLVDRTTARIQRNMTLRLVGHLLKIDLAVLGRDRIGALQGRISRSVEGYVKFLKVCFSDLAPAILLAAFALGAGLWQQWRVGLVMVGVVPLSMLITFWQVHSQAATRLRLLRAKENLDGTVVEQLGGLEYIRAANTYAIELGRVESATESTRAQTLKHSGAMAGFDWLKSVNEGLFHVAIIGYALILAARGEIEFGKVVTFSFLFLNIMRPMRDVHRILDETYDSAIQVSMLLGMLQEPVDQSFNVVTLRAPKLDGSVPLLECRDLAVEYAPAPGQPPRRALDGATLAILRGQTVGVAGRSGSGKSTWLRAVLRLVHPASGEVLVGGVPIGVLSREDIGKSIGYVSQTPFVFSGTVRDNIAYGCGSGVGQEEIVEAARQAHIHEEIEGMAEGYQTMLAERGANLSGGQRQRLALARMFLKNPPLLILDEGTSALDNISERRVRAAIDHARQSHTVIMVAHRLSTLNECDRIFVFNQGRVVEEGSYGDLVARDGVFAELVKSADAS